MSIKKFAAFIITYERPQILANTISIVLSQSYPPSKLLIVDNSDTEDTKQLIKFLANPIIEYLHVGYNSGPAGGARIGLERLADEGYNWIYWGDDDDPPRTNDYFEKILLSHKIPENCSCLGYAGHNFNSITGQIVYTKNKEINGHGLLRVDTIAGGMGKIINGEFIRKTGCLPDENLFFGFEELDFDLKSARHEYHPYCLKELFLELRKQSGKSGVKSTDKISKKNLNLLVRDYYSHRNLFKIFYENRYFTAFLILFVKTILKSFYGFYYGVNYGIVSFKLYLASITDFLRGRYGKIENLSVFKNE